MFTNRARILVIGMFVILMVVAIKYQVYQLAAAAAMFVVILIYGYFKQGTIVLAAKAFHNKEYDKAEELLKQVYKPEVLSKKRRGFYEFIYGGVCLQKQDFDAAEQHYELAALFPLRNANDHVAALVHVANINVRKGNWDKAKAYLQLTEKYKDNITAKMKDVIQKVRQEVQKH
ncbi:tetratricopeptide repeat protein [Mucilaginibacter sp. 21P]|uniref:tetratricopeptide repeat protein n=1 Tax=Mucilaginibacter sp. 21P TaxID=2778902 RepID=UPI001C5A14B6|nr:tetratricopeptide repeat protein [Mucilaginibacter sp. 21P]QXV66934.1 tetratricopeptide repeat protein [Mucilaginibacter sp. 21P]